MASQRIVDGIKARPIIIDTDPGQDDAIAILLALASPELKVVAVTTVAGNVPQPLVTENSLGLLALAGREDIPVHMGCDAPLVRDLITAEYVHGPTGVDGAILPSPSSEVSPLHAVDAIIAACHGASDEGITLCPLGPLTNIASAITKDPSIVPHIREIVWMGGAFDEPGNTTDLAEFNAIVDPDAAHIVFTSGAPITIFPLDVTHKALMLPQHVDALGAFGTDVAVAAAGMIKFYETYDVEKYDIPGAPLHDPCVIAHLIDDSVFSGEVRSIAIEREDEESLGNTYTTDGDGPTAMVMSDVDAPAFFAMVIERVGAM